MLSDQCQKPPNAKSCSTMRMSGTGWHCLNFDGTNSIYEVHLLPKSTYFKPYATEGANEAAEEYIGIGLWGGCAQN